MTRKQMLRKLGWSAELVDAMESIAFETPTLEDTGSASTSALLADVDVLRATGATTVDVRERPPVALTTIDVKAHDR